MTKRKYWLGEGDPSEQDHFFIKALDASIWEQGDRDNWDTCWYTGMPDDDVFESLTAEQTVNHIPGNSALTIKSNLYQTLVAAKSRVAGTAHEKRFDFFPETFVMPEDYFRFQHTAQKEPEQIWIKKPKNLSRGRGIDMVRQPSTIPFDDEWLVQRYLSNPHLCHGRKYVLRCYVLITSVEPLRFYWYQDGFAKLASEAYSTDDLHNLYRHLTNPDINEENESAGAAVTFISFKRYREWLQSEGHDAALFFSALKDMIALTVIAAREAMRRRTRVLGAEDQQCYELIGLDCMVDENIKPWIIECNLSPSLSTYADPAAGADDEVSAKRNMVRDLVNILGLNDLDKHVLTHQERYHYEAAHSGGFECLFPSQAINHYLPVFPIPRYSDIDSAGLCGIVDPNALSVTPTDGSDYTFSDSLLIFGEHTRSSMSLRAQVIVPNELATWIWLKISIGESPESIVDELLNTLSQPEGACLAAWRSSLQYQVWDVLADWGQAHVFAKRVVTESDNCHRQTPCTAYIYFGRRAVELNFFCDAAADYWRPFFQSLRQDDAVCAQVDIAPSPYGYSIIHNRTMLTPQVMLASIFSAIYSSLMNVEIEKGGQIIAGCVMSSDHSCSVVVSQSASVMDDFSLFTSNAYSHAIIEGNTVLIHADGVIEPLLMPLKLTSVNDFIDKPLKVIAESDDYDLSPYLMESRATFFDSQVKVISSVIFIEASDKGAIDVVAKSDVVNGLWHAYPSGSHESLTRLADWVAGLNSCYRLSIQVNKKGFERGLSMLMDKRIL